jgi:RNA polymerase sigma-70 factor, ECF subfamily
VLRLLSRATPAAQVAVDSDAALLRQLKAGDAHAEATLFSRHRVAVARFLRDLLRDGDLAEEGCQETFARAHVQLKQFEDGERLKAWLFGIARNIAFEMRRSRHSGRVNQPLADDEEGVPDAVIPAPNPEQVLLDKELSVHFAAALDSLGENRKAALLMRIDHHLPYEDIALAFGWSLPTVKNEIHRARLKLRAALLPHL